MNTNRQTSPCTFCGHSGHERTVARNQAIFCGPCYRGFKDLLYSCHQWIKGNIDNDELRSETGCKLTDDQLEEYSFIGGDPELAKNHGEILFDAIFPNFAAKARENTNA